MLITILDSTGTPKAELSPNDSSTQVKEIQGDSILTLSFTHYDHISLDVDDYVDFEGERFWLTEKYRPRQNARKEWVYDIKLYGVESMLKRLLVIKTVDDEDDPVFTLTAPPREHVAMIVRCMNNGLGNITDWKVGQVDGTENIVIDYFGKYCDEALKEIAEKVGVEAWVEGQTVNICKCEHGEPIPMGYDKGLLSIDPGTADNVKFYTRLYPVGSSRNIDREKYGYSRLQLPGGQKYVEINADKYGRVDHYEAEAFADIYPRRTGIVSNVRSEVKTGEDGNPFTIYFFSDNSLPFDPNAYEIGGLVKRMSFQEGSELAGLGKEDNGTYYFEVNFNSTTREFEIITIWPYDNDMQLPGDKLIPKIGDKYILWNLRMPDEYYELAEAEFMSAVDKYNADHSLDISVYKAPTDHVWIEDNEVVLTIGQRIRLESDEYFPETGYRDSRITKITRKVNLPSSMDIEISDALSRTSQEKMLDSINDVRSYAKSIRESSNLPDIIRSGDKTLPTDNNLFSARRSQKEFLQKTRPDRTPHKLSSDKGFEVGEYQPGENGGMLGIDADGDSFAEIARLYVRVKAFFEELTVVKASVLAGKQYITPGGGIKCTQVIETANAYRCYFLSEQDGEKTETKFIVNDQAISEMFNAKAGTANKVSNHRYWRLVTAVNQDAYTDDNGNHYGYIDLSKTKCETGGDVPAAGDEICQLGYQGNDNKERQTAMMFSTVDPDAPCIKLYSGIDSFSLADKAIVSFGRDPQTGNIFFRLGNSTAKQYLDYTQDGGLKIAGSISLLSTYDGEKLGDYIDEAAQKIVDAAKEDVVSDVDMLYIQTGSAVTPPSLPAVDATTGQITDFNGWSTTAPSWADGMYMWQLTYTRYGDGQVTFAGPTCISGARGQQGLQGIQGRDGAQGIQGPAGADGKTPYFHIKYSAVANPTSASQMTETPSTYIGTYVDYTQADSNDPKKYTWARFQGMQGADGAQGIPGVNGQDGKTSYLHIKYSNDSGKTFTPAAGGLAIGETPGDYIGQYVDFTQVDSTDPTKYTWSKIVGATGPKGDPGQTGPQGVAGPAGKDGATLYTWVRYADNAQGGGISNNPRGKAFIGFAYNKTTPNESNTPSDYTWSEIKGEQGIQGPKGADGTQYYTWIQYSDNANGTPMYQQPTANTKYIGIAVNKTTATESNDPSDYTWSLFKGADGTSVTISSQSVKYSTLHTASQPADSTFTLPAVPTLSAGQYLWSLTTVNYSNGQNTKSYAVSKIGVDGAAGASYSNNLLLGTETPCTSIGSYTRYNLVETLGAIGSGNKLTLSFDYEYSGVSTSKADDTAHKYDYRLGGELNVKQADGSNNYNFGVWVTLSRGASNISGKGRVVKTLTIPANATDAYTYFPFMGQVLSGSVKIYNIKLERGEVVDPQWTPAASEMVAPTITATSVTYAKTTASTQPADSAFIYSSIGATGVGPGEYLWTKSIVTYSDGSSTKSYSVGRIGSDGEDGIQGPAGADGKTTYVHYAYANSANGATDFSTTYFTGALYVGVCTDYNKADPTTYTSYQWARLKGEDGRGLDTINEYYAVNNSNTTAPTSWQKNPATVPVPTATNRYLWNYEEIIYTAGTPLTTQPRIIGTHGVDGTSATVTSTSVTYQVGASGTTAPTGTWSTSIPAVDEGEYLWAKTVVNYSDGKSTTTYSVSRQGKDGTAWGNGKMLYIDPTFKKGLNKFSVYNNKQGSADVTVTHTHLDDSTAPNDSGKVIKVSNTGEASPGMGGFVQTTRGRLAATFICRYIAKIPVGYIIKNANNNLGKAANGLKIEWLTPVAGTGKWEEYLLKIHCADSLDDDEAALSTFGHIYIQPASGPLVYGTQTKPIDWYVAYATIFDMDGNGEFQIDSTEVRYAKGNYASQPADSTFTLASPGTLTKGQWLWTRTIVNYSDGQSTKSYSASYIGNDGVEGQPGANGYLHIAYASGITGSLPHPTSVTGFSTTSFAGAKYIGICTDNVAADPTTNVAQTYEWSDYVGEDGRSYISTDEYYLATADGVNAPTSGWKTNFADAGFSETNKYLWNYEVSHYDKAPLTETSAARVIGVWGKSGTAAKIVVVNADATAFTYSDDFATLVGPVNIQLTATLQGTTGYQWSYKTAGASSFTNLSGATGAGYTLAHNASIWGTAKSITMRCASGGVYDEVTIIKVSSGCNGENGSSYSDNLYLNSGYEHGTDEWVLFKSCSKSIADKVLIVASTGSEQIVSNKKISVKQGDKFTLSGWIKADSELSLNYCYLMYESGGNQNLSSKFLNGIAVTSDWKFFILQFSASRDGIASPGFGWKNASGTTTYLKELKWERGYNDNPVWTPAASEMVGQDAYTLLLSNESHIFEGDTEKAIGASVGSEVFAYKGATRIAATIGAITGMPAGMTVSISNNGTTSAKFTITVTTALKTKQGTLTVPVTVDGKSFTQVFSWSLSLRGKDGRGIVAVVEEYALSATTSAPAGSAFGSTIPTMTDAQPYLWNREKTTYTDNTSETTTAIMIGVKGQNGAAGASVMDITNFYLASDKVTGVTDAMSGWVTDASQAVTSAEKPYLWNYEVTEWSKGAPTYTQPHIIGTFGSGYTDNLLLKTDVPVSNGNYPTARYNLAETPVVGDTYTFTLWGQLAATKTNFAIYNSGGSVYFGTLKKVTDGKYSLTFQWKNSNDSGTTVTPAYINVYPYSSSQAGISSIERVKLEKGTNANPQWTPNSREMQAPAITEQYFLSTSNTTLTGGSWQNTAPTWVPGKFIWTRTKIEYATGEITYTDPVCATGAAAPNLMVQYSADGSSWHPLYAAGDIWMRTSNDGGVTWGPAVRVQGANYAPNLLLGSKTGYLLSSSDYINNTSYSTATNSDGFLEYTLKALVVANNQQYRYLWVESKLAEYFQEGETYTFSAEVKSTAAGYVGIDSRSPSSPVRIRAEFAATNGEWRRVSATLKMAGINGNIQSLLSYGFSNGAPVNSTLSVRKVCLTKGTSAEYVPAASEMVGIDGPWRKFQWAKNTSSTTAPTSNWQDAPMTAAAGEYVWMRSGLVIPPATAPASYDPATRLTGDTGAAGSSVYMLDMDNEVAGVACNAAGTVVATTLPSTNLKVYKGGAEDSGWTFTKDSAVGCTATVSSSKLVIQSLSADTATVTVKATKTGCPTLMATMNIYKVKPGAQGSQGDIGPQGPAGESFSSNLIVGSKEFKAVNGGTGITSTINANGELVVVAASGNANWFTNFWKSLNTAEIEDNFAEGDDFTISFTIKSANSNGQIPKAYIKSGMGYYAMQGTISDKYSVIRYSGKWKKANDIQPHLGFSLCVGTYTIKNWKLEKGVNTNPVWTPAASEMIGIDGQDAVVYQLELSANNISRDALGQLSATSITVQKFKTTGSSGRVLTTDHTVRYRRIGVDADWQTLLGGISTYSLTVPNNPAMTAIVVELLAGTTVLDRERIPVIQDGAELTENLALKSQVNISSTEYKLALVTTSEDFIVGNTYTFTVWGNLGAGRVFRIYNDKVTVFMGALEKIADGIYSAVLQWKNPTTTGKANQFYVVQYPGTASTASVIEKVKVEKGANYAPVWTKSDHDIDYITRALQEGNQLDAGLILATLMRMGYTVENGDYKVMAGINGIAEPQDAIAVWGGGDMIDRAKAAALNAALFALRHDGTAYFCGNTVRFLQSLMQIGDNVQLDKNGLSLIVNNNTALHIGNVAVSDAQSASTLNQSIVNKTCFCPTSFYNASGGNIYPVGVGGAVALYDSTVNAGTIMSGQGIISAPYVEGAARSICVDILIGTTVIVTYTYIIDPELSQIDFNISNIKIPTQGKVYVRLRWPYELQNGWSDKGFGNPYDSAQLKFTSGSLSYSTGNQTTLGKNGILAVWGQSTFLCNDSMVMMRFGNNILKLSSAGIQKSTNGGSSWANL